MYGGAVIAFGSVDLGFAVWMGLYMLFLVAVLPAISLKVTWKWRVRLKKENSRLYTRLTDGVLGLGDWLASGRAAEFVQQQEEAEEQVDAIRRKLRRWTRWRDLMAQSVIGLLVVSVTLWAGNAASVGQLPAVMIAAFVLVLFPLTESLLPVGDAVEHLPQYRESLDRLKQLEGKGYLPGQNGAGYADGTGDSISVVKNGNVMAGQTSESLPAANGYPGQTNSSSHSTQTQSRHRD